MTFLTRVHILLAAMATLLVLAGCAGTSLNGVSWNPEERTVLLYGTQVVSIPEGMEFKERRVVAVQGYKISAIDRPRDVFATHIFTDGNSMLLAQRLAKTNQSNKFRFLGGTKVTENGTEWRSATYTLMTNSTDFEYRKYAVWMNEFGLAASDAVTVQVKDALLGDFVLVRVLRLTPANGEHTAMPPFGKMYEQERTTDESRVLIP